MIIVLRRPMALAIHPDTTLPTRPQIARSIIANPPIPCAFSSLPAMLCTQVGVQEKIAHRPISIAPNINAPVTRFFL